MKKLLFVSLAITGATFGSPAFAAPSLGELRVEMRASLAKRQDLVQAVALIRDQVALSPPPVERGFQISRRLQALGPDAFYPMIDLLDGQKLASISPRAQSLLKVATLDALTHLGDARGSAIYEKLFDEDSDLEVARAAAEALGATESSDGMQFLLDRAIVGHPKERAAFSGLSFCRKGEVAHRFAARFLELPDARLVRSLAQRASFWGSSWAWQALGPGRQAEGLAGRQALSEALVSVLPNYEGDTRQAISNALVAIEHPATRQSLAQLRSSAKPDLVKTIDLLSSRLK